MSESTFWDIDVPWADAAATRTISTEGQVEHTDIRLESGGVLSLVDDSTNGVDVTIHQGSVTLFAGGAPAVDVLTAGRDVTLRAKHWWRNDSDDDAVVRFSRPAQS